MFTYIVKFSSLHANVSNNAIAGSVAFHPRLLCWERDAAAVRDNGNIRNDGHRQRLLDDWIWKLVKPSVDARVARRAWSWQT
jgi:hypothetical protein